MNSSDTTNGTPAPRTMFDKIWDQHVIVEQTDDTPAIIGIDLHLVHEVTSPQAFDMLRERSLGVRCPQQTIATMDHSTPTTPLNTNHGALPVIDDSSAAAQLAQLRRNCREFGVRLLDMDSPNRGIVHVIGPELGLTQPGMTIVCGDSHTSTHGAFGSLAFGIGTTEVGHVLAAQSLLQRRPRTMAVDITGKLQPGVTAKDLILAIIAEIGVRGGTGHVLEYRGEAIETMSMEQRMTVCNMSIEAGARAGMIAPDDTTLEYLRGRPHAPRGAAWDETLKRWRSLPSDPGARFDRTVQIDASNVRPMITWGTHPGMAIAVDDVVPVEDGSDGYRHALEYMGLTAGQSIGDVHIDRVFIGSCTNARIEDLRAAASIVRGRRVAPDVQMMVVPGSQCVKRQAEAEQLDGVFIAAGAQWREPGCSMCIAMNGDRAAAGEYIVSTSNRNFIGRQGAGARTMLASPLTAAAAAIAGRIVDPRKFRSQDCMDAAHVREKCA